MRQFFSFLLGFALLAAPAGAAVDSAPQPSLAPLAGAAVDSAPQPSLAPLPQATASSLPFRTNPDDALTREGFLRFYNMDYPGAIVIFRQEEKLHPDDPYVVNHLLAAVLAEELNREGDLDATLYMGNKFTKMQEQPVDPQVKQEIAALSSRALGLANQTLAKNPNDVSALYARAVARGLATVYTAVIEKHWLGALREALGAYHDEEHILKIDPKYADAKLIVGAYQYIVGTLSWYEKAIAYVVDIHGNKDKGLKLLHEAAFGGGEASMDAKTILALFLAREKRYKESIAIVSREYSDFPHNFIYGIAEADLLQASGQRDAAIAAYRKLAALGEQGFFPNARAERAALELGEALRKQDDYAAAARAFDQAANFPRANSAIVARADLEAGEMYDLLGRREEAVDRYHSAVAAAPGSPDAQSASRFIDRPFTSGSGG